MNYFLSHAKTYVSTGGMLPFFLELRDLRDRATDHESLLRMLAGVISASSGSGQADELDELLPHLRELSASHRLLLLVDGLDQAHGLSLWPVIFGI